MDWKDVGKVIAPLAPIAGSILGGFIPFPGGSIIGQKLGEMIAGAFGVPPTPAAVSEAVANSTEETARVKINAAVEQARVQVQGFVEIEKAYLHAIEVGLTQTGETMRVEVLPQNRHWFFTGWRPACGWVLVIHAFTFGCMLAIAAFRAAFFDNAAPLNSLSDAWKIYLAYFGALGAVVGVAIFARSEDKKYGVDTSTVPAKLTPTPPVKVPEPVKPPVKPAGGFIPKPVGSKD